MTLASFPMTSISSKAHKIDFSYFLFTVDATFLYYVQSRNLAEKISIPAELVVPVRVTQTLYGLKYNAVQAIRFRYPKRFFTHEGRDSRENQKGL